MKAIIREKAGKEFSTMKVEEIQKQEVNSIQIRVKMASSRINPVDMDLMKGMPFIKYKKPQIGGIDGAGTVTEIGSSVNDLAIGAQVFFYRKFTDIGTWGEEIIINRSDVAKIPQNISLKDAGAIALPLLTAYDALMQLHAQPGEKILIHGAGGGVGFQAVQIAQKLGLEVIATASQRDVEALNKVGVSKIIDYKTQSFELELQPTEVDYIFDVIGKDVLAKSIALKPKKVVSVAYVDTDKMYKTGIQMPSILKWVMKLTMSKFTKAARKNGVEIIGQVTGANGELLEEASKLINKADFYVKPYQQKTLQEIERNELSAKDIGKVIIFN